MALILSAMALILSLSKDEAMFSGKGSSFETAFGLLRMKLSVKAHGSASSWFDKLTMRT